MAEIEREIARSRAELSFTLDALVAELAPRHLVEKGFNMVSDFLSRNRPGGVSLGAAIRADPVALALIGLGVAWLAAENIGLLDGMTQWRHGGRPGDYAQPVPRIESSGEPALEGRAVGSSNEGWMQWAAGAAQGALRSICGGSSAAVGRAGAYVGDAIHSVEHAGNGGAGLGSRLMSNPLLLGAAGLAAGSLIAIFLPATRREQEVVAQTRADLWERAEELGHRAADGVRGMAESATRASASD